MLDLIREIYERVEPADPALWHRRMMWWPVRTIDGRLDVRVWRRWRNGRWEYASRQETEDERQERVY